MFYMRELPSRDMIDAMGRVYPELDSTALEACYVLLRTGSDVLTAFDENLSRHHITQSRFIVLLLLKRIHLRHLSNGEMNPSNLAEQAGVSRGTMIERELQNGDRRRFAIRMTEKGNKTLDRIFPDYYNRIAGLMENLSEEERGTLIALLNKVKSGIPALRVS